jgi:poly(3-hydroxybutyrate) depolymerase
MVAWTESNFCVDSARILSVGMSVGGEGHAIPSFAASGIATFFSQF